MKLVEPSRCGVVISTYGSAPFVALQLESSRRFVPDAQVLIHDDCSADPALQELAHEYGAALVTPAQGRLGHTRGDMSAFATAVEWAQGRALDVVVKVSRRMVPTTSWFEPVRQALAGGAATAGNADVAFGWPLRTEFVALEVRRWAAHGSALRAFPGGFVEEFMGSLAARVGPIEPMGWLGESRTVDVGRWLWYSFASAQRYADLARVWGLGYGPEDFDVRANLEDA